MNHFKKTPVQTFTKGSVVTNEDCQYWKQLGVSLFEFVISKKSYCFGFCDFFWIFF